MKVLSANNRTLPLKNLEHQISIFLSTKLFVLFSFLTLSFMIFQLFSPIVSSNAETENTAKVSTPAGTISLATEDNVTINITPTPTQKIYSKTTALKITNSCKKGATITLSTNKSHNNLERQGTDTLTKAIASITTTGNLTDNSWGYTLDNTNYLPVPTKDQSPATIYNTTSDTTSTTTPENLNLTYAVKTDDTIPSGTYTNDLVYTVNVKPECLQYTLKFNLDNGTGKPGAVYTDRQLSYGTKVNLADFTPTRTDYEFMGWIATTNNPATTPVTYNPTANLDVNPANETEVTLKAKWKYTKGIHSIANMQQMTAKTCKESTTPSQTATALDTDGSHAGDPNYVPTVTLTDTRDNNTYTVSKLADGKCWMTQNLRIINKTITPDDSNVTTNYTIPASSISGFNAYDTSNAYVDSDSGLYNWYTATAGTGTQAMSINGQNTPASICPKGWRLPTGGNRGEFKTLYDNYPSSSVLRSNPVNLALSGYVSSGSRIHQSIFGLYWSSTIDSSSYAYYLHLNTSGVYPTNVGDEYNGFSVRCIADDKLGLNSIANMQQMTSDICVATTTPNRTATALDTDGSHAGDPNYVPTKTLVDTRDNNTYTVSKLADGKCWMTQNLRIINKTITPADSNVTANYTIPASSLSGFGSNNTSNAYIDNTYGGYYSWYTATAGTGTYSMSSGKTLASICPKGWRLPTGGRGKSEYNDLYEKYNSSSMLTSSPVNMNMAGYIAYGGFGQYGTYSRYWASTAYSQDYANLTYMDATSADLGTYDSKNRGITVRCIADNPTIHSISNMQQMTPNVCANTTTPLKTSNQLDTDGSHHGDPNYVPTKTLVDTRDSNTYTVSKLADGKCWMTQNLRIAGKTITPADSNVTANYTIPASSINGFSSNDTSNAYVDSDSGLYNWYTATAGTGTQAMSSGNATASICPKGWSLPTSGSNGEFQILYNNYNSSSALSSNPVNLTLSGYVSNSSRIHQGIFGYYWSSTVSTSYAAYTLYLGTASGVGPADFGNKDRGFSVRCLAR